MEESLTRIQIFISWVQSCEYLEDILPCYNGIALYVVPRVTVTTSMMNTTTYF